MSQVSPRIEVRKVNEIKGVPANIARDLKQRIEAGKALVVAERPVVVLSLIRKRWAQLEREV